MANAALTFMLDDTDDALSPGTEFVPGISVSDIFEPLKRNHSIRIFAVNGFGR